jgi:sugar phosphate isomerase/epimerase
VALALEPLHPMYAGDRSCLTTLAEALDICDALDPAGDGGIGVAVDCYHVWWDPALAAGIARAGEGGRILAFHVCDWLVPTTDMLLDRGMMGDGVIDIAGIRAEVERAGFAGAVECEIFSAANWWRREAEETLAVCAERFQSVC